MRCLAGCIFDAKASDTIVSLPRRTQTLAAVLLTDSSKKIGGESDQLKMTMHKRTYLK